MPIKYERPGAVSFLDRFSVEGACQALGSATTDGACSATGTVASCVGGGDVPPNSCATTGGTAVGCDTGTIP